MYKVSWILQVQLPTPQSRTVPQLRIGKPRWEMVLDWLDKGWCWDCMKRKLKHRDDKKYVIKLTQ